MEITEMIDFSLALPLVKAIVCALRSLRLYERAEVALSTIFR